MINIVLNSMAAGAAAAGLIGLAYAMMLRHHLWLATGALIWATGFILRVAAIVDTQNFTDKGAPPWVRTWLLEFSWVYHGVGALTLIVGVHIMMHQERPSDVYDALEKRINGSINGTQ